MDDALIFANELHDSGLDWHQAWGKAILEYRFQEWPTDWGENFYILIYGDFNPPKSEINIKALGITIYPEKKENTVIPTALCVLKAKVTIKDKTTASLTDAVRRINVLLGSLTLIEWGNGAVGWWSHITHDNMGGVITDLDEAKLNLTIDGVLGLPAPIKRKIDAVLYWVREPRKPARESYRNDILRIYSAYWNAFECLVGAINILSPQPPLNETKQNLLDKFISKHEGGLTVPDIEQCYQEIINPGLVRKASHALKICFPAQREHEKYINECFKLEDKGQRLYNIRNEINHGEIDAENPDELIRIDSRLSQLWLIVWGMFGRLVPFPAPVDPAFIKNET